MTRRYMRNAVDQVVGHIVLREDHSFVDTRGIGSSYAYKAGERLPVARAITTAAGRTYRLMHTIEWIPEHLCIPDNQAIVAAAFNVDPIISNSQLNDLNAFKNVVNRATVNKVKKPVKFCTGTKQNIKPQPNNKKRNNTMEKSALKSVINALTPGQVIGITFIGDKAHLSRDWTVVKVRTGKGKGGSKLLELVDSARNTITTGTPDSSYILNMTVNGTMHGYSSEAEVPVVYESNPTQAAELKESFRALVGAEGDRQVSVQSSITDLNGRFTVLRGTQLRGRGGQIRLDLERVGSGERVEVWSLRHSGVIQSFQIEPNS